MQVFGLKQARDLHEIIEEQARAGSTGSLHLSRESQAMRLTFEQGVLVQVEWRDGSLGEYLIAFTEEEALDRIFGAFDWEIGEWQFAPAALPEGFEVLYRIPIEDLLTNLDKRHKEVRSLEEGLPSPYAVIGIAGEPATFADDIPLHRSEFKVLAQIDGRTTLGDILRTSIIGRTAAVGIMANLFDKGVLEIRQGVITSSGAVSTGPKTADQLRGYRVLAECFEEVFATVNIQLAKFLGEQLWKHLQEKYDEMARQFNKLPMVLSLQETSKNYAITSPERMSELSYSKALRILEAVSEEELAYLAKLLGEKARRKAVLAIQERQKIILKRDEALLKSLDIYDEMKYLCDHL